MNATVESISYQSEESTFGIKASSSIISSTKTLIFSKIHFNYNELYYFSNTLNNLSTFEEDIKNSSLTKASNSTKINKFIRNLNTENGKKQKTNNINNLDFLSTVYKLYNYVKSKTLSLSEIGGTMLAVSFFGGWIALHYMVRKYWEKENKLLEYKKRMVSARENTNARVNSSVSSKLNKSVGIQSGNRHDNGITIRRDNDTYSDDGYISVDNNKLKMITDFDGKGSLNHSASQTVDDVNDAESTINDLYLTRIPEDSRNNVSKSQFRAQVIGYSNIRSNEELPVVHSVNAETLKRTNEWIPSKVSLGGISYDVTMKKHIKDMSSLRSDDISKSLIDIRTTKYGWFKIPTINEIDASILSDDQKMYIKDQIAKFQEIYSSIPLIHYMDDSQNVNKIISSQILADLRELTFIYLNSISTDSVLQGLHSVNDAPKTSINNDFVLNDFFLELIESRPLRSNLDLSHIGIEFSDIQHVWEKISLLKI